ncbi:MAG TPA: thioredoxin [Aquifex aeolicus]|nr:thioredoxin [Aquifex aeolicus]
MKIVALLSAFVFLLGCGNDAGVKGESVSEEGVERKEIIPKKDYALLIVESKSCIYCKQLDKDIRSEKSLQEALRDIDLFKVLYESYRPVRANFGGKVVEMPERELVRTLGALSFPNLIFYTREGEIVLQIPGYVYPSQLVCIIDYVKSGAHREMDVNTYVKNKGCA